MRMVQFFRAPDPAVGIVQMHPNFLSFLIEEPERRAPDFELLDDNLQDFAYKLIQFRLRREKRHRLCKRGTLPPGNLLRPFSLEDFRLE